MTGKKKAARVLQHPTAMKSSQISNFTKDNITDNSATKELTTAASNGTGVGGRDADATERAKKTVRKCDEWISANPTAWSSAEAMVVERAERGTRVGTQDVVEYIRWHDFTGTDGTPTKVNNNLAPVMIRRICHLHPEVVPLVDLRTSVYDEIIGPVRGATEGRG